MADQIIVYKTRNNALKAKRYIDVNKTDIKDIKSKRLQQYMFLKTAGKVRKQSASAIGLIANLSHDVHLIKWYQNFAGMKIIGALSSKTDLNELLKKAANIGCITSNSSVVYKASHKNISFTLNCFFR